MTLLTKLFFTMLILLGESYLLSWGFYLLNLKSDLAVLGGAVGIFCLIPGGGYPLYLIWKKEIKKALEELNEEIKGGK